MVGGSSPSGRASLDRLPFVGVFGLKNVAQGLQAGRGDKRFTRIMIRAVRPLRALLPDDEAWSALRFGVTRDRRVSSL